MSNISSIKIYEALFCASTAISLKCLIDEIDDYGDNNNPNDEQFEKLLLKVFNREFYNNYIRNTEWKDKIKLSLNDYLELVNKCKSYCN
jgi:hypothetical protein